MENENTKALTARQGSPFLTTKEAAHYLRLSPRTLEKMRVTGSGPNYRKHGRYVRYNINDLNAWSENGRKKFLADKGRG